MKSRCQEVAGTLIRNDERLIGMAVGSWSERNRSWRRRSFRFFCLPILVGSKTWIETEGIWPIPFTDRKTCVSEARPVTSLLGSANRSGLRVEKFPAIFRTYGTDFEWAAQFVVANARVGELREAHPRVGSNTSVHPKLSAAKSLGNTHSGLAIENSCTQYIPQILTFRVFSASCGYRIQ